MKRKWFLDNIKKEFSTGILDIKNPSSLVEQKYKKICINNQDLSSISNISPHISDLLDEVLIRSKTITDNKLEINDYLKFVFFLGIEGKKHIRFINQKFDAFFISPIFISSNFSPESSDNIIYTSNEECIRLSKYFKVLDPLGGGIYPLDCMMVIDRAGFMRCKFLLRVSQYYSFYEENCIDLAELDKIVTKILQSIQLEEMKWD